MDKFIVNKEGWYSFISTTKPEHLEYLHVGDVVTFHGAEIKYKEDPKYIKVEEYHID